MKNGHILMADGTVRLVSGSTFVISDLSGDMELAASHGFFHHDVRPLSRFELVVNDRRVDPLAARILSPSLGRFVLRLPWDGPGESPLVAVRNRSVQRGLHEELIITNHGPTPVRFSLALRIAADFRNILRIKVSTPERRRGPIARARVQGSSLLLGSRRVGDVGTRVHVKDGSPRMTKRGPEWRITIQPGRTWRTSIDVKPVAAVTVAPADTETSPAAPRMSVRANEWKARFPIVRSRWEGFDRLYAQCVEDLSVLLMEDVEAEDLVVAAGFPWFMTLFGRDAILTSLMTLPFDRDLATGVLHALSRRQGRQDHEASEEEPGKILHEIRHGEGARGGHAVYYGTVDATPLFIVLLGQARRWGLPMEDVRDALPSVQRALGWTLTYGDPDGDGYIEYEERPEPALRNQGWKDSWDGIQFANGRLPRGLIALCEVQGYKHLALTEAAALFEALDYEEESAWARKEAAQLAERFRRDFWMDARGYVALALDGRKRQVDAIASNAAHLLWTNILTPEQTLAVARALVSPDMFSGWGLRTLAASNRGYNPVSYHAGSVWPHDTAVAAGGLGRRGFVDEALTLVRGLVDASSFVGNRLPELFCGFSREEFDFPVAYPPSCMPQAWAGASALLLLRTLLGFRPDLPAGRLGISPILPPDALPFHIEGMHVGDGTLSLTVHEGGRVELIESPDGLEIVQPNVRQAIRAV